ncbi:histone-lysine N-methyltransferase EHMT2 [Fusarium agapanthi]|uniref:Histone-lysine N-methyltransferase EHMT2 n=1 Tax=Fusarium agapanthi TaxID=1803897 RepID=A0A9P5EGM6_9HYPO|nr:histone-lysine N-methyltransferase EHMT2 [Fusarium agapanthi]
MELDSIPVPDPITTEIDTSTEYPDTPPDGGYGWVIIFVCFVHTFWINIWAGSWGILSGPISPSNQQPYPSSLPPGATLARITEATLAPRATWTSFQTGRDEHMEFNSDIVFINHSCDTNLVVDTTRMEVRVADDRHIAKGDELTWFYPSAEWEMAQSIPCEFGTKRCLVAIRGSRYVEPERLKGYFLNKHIRDLMEEQNSKQ